MTTTGGFRSLIRNFLRGDTGSISAEFVIWTPVFALVLSLVADTSLIFGSAAEVTRVVQDANRSLSLGRFMTVGEAKPISSARSRTSRPTRSST
jgi:Flp pilus assembly protein TadG